jgi:hypothetical protein
MGRRWAIPAACAAALFAVSCGSPKPPDQTAAVLEACTQLHQALGALQSGCFGGAATDWQAYRDEQAPCTMYAQDVAAGSVKFEAGALAGCLSDIQASSCYWPSQCENTNVFVGQAADGTPCTDADWDICGPQSICPTYFCNPTCQPNVEAALGQPCGGTGCQWGLTCDAGQNDICVAPAAEGGYCGGISDDPCQETLYCMLVDPNNTPSGGTCVPLPTGACSYDYQCSFDQFCYQGACKQKLAVGSPCGDAQTGCEGFSVCDTTSTSPTCVHTGLLGEPCERIYLACLGGAVCNDSTDICVPPGQLGDVCSGFRRCASPLVCYNDSCVAQCPSADAAQP